MDRDEAPWRPKLCRRCGINVIAGHGGEVRGKRSLGKKAYLCWWCAFPREDPPPCKVCSSTDYWTGGHCRNCHPKSVQRQCLHCYAYGAAQGVNPKSWAFYGAICRACVSWRLQHEAVGPCTFCQRTLPLQDGACRLCWLEARRRVEPQHHERPLDTLERYPFHQLFFASTQRSPRLRLPHRVRTGSLQEIPIWRPSRTVQTKLFEVPRDLSNFDRSRHADLRDPRLAHARALAGRLAEQRGWTRDTAKNVHRALVIVLSGQPDDGNPIRYSDLATLSNRKISAERTADVLREMDMLYDDRPNSQDAWIDAQLADLAPQIRREVLHWTKFLRGDLPRSVARARDTISSELGYIKPALLCWSQRYDSLREVTRDDVKKVILDPVKSLSHRTHVLKVLRSLFRRLKRDQLIFRNPTTHLKLPMPDRLTNAAILQDQELRRAFDWARSRPERRILVAFAAAQALQPGQMRMALLDDVDLGERVIAINGDPRPLHELTYEALVDYLDYRRRRWPSTSNPHLLLTQQTAAEAGPVSKTWTKLVMRPLGITLRQLRHDRLLDELLAAGPDPLHFQAVFDCSQSMAMNYVEAAKRLLAQDPRFQPLSPLNAYMSGSAPIPGGGPATLRGVVVPRAGSRRAAPHVSPATTLPSQPS